MMLFVVVVTILATEEKDLVKTPLLSRAACENVLKQTYVVEGLHYDCVPVKVYLENNNGNYPK